MFKLKKFTICKEKKIILDMIAATCLEIVRTTKGWNSKKTVKNHLEEHFAINLDN